MKNILKSVKFHPSINIKALSCIKFKLHAWNFDKKIIIVQLFALESHFNKLQHKKSFSLRKFQNDYSTPVDLKEKRTPTLLISLDGLRASSLDQFLVENPDSILKKKIVDVGVKADFMQPGFPTLTFPNHYTIVTGLYMENHGIVGNSYYDPEADRIVRFLSDKDSLQPRWWNKTDPIWLTAKNQESILKC
ncbi:type I phosphodiesterase nucleotide pyrophosphatase family [Brachionus plicatilis]|uniref:Type I phosphodiesterase nucleotide pyrophosphatase family n=1 Tax=Brachionus plicatilis TaxID=10195 RepID=A0A3M7QMT5_BRAPC|nr:type I phosphodiesterase nucleotide pyrophosphatase family [Brachionus plicatilis]